MKLVILGSIGLDDIETPADSGSDLLGGAAAHAGIAAGFHLHMATHLSPEIGLVSAVGNDFPIDAQTTLENSGLNLAGVIRKDGSLSLIHI